VLRETLRAALRPEPAAGATPAGPDPAAVLEQLRRQRDDLRHREAALDAARLDLARSERLIGDQRREIDARAQEAERLMATARRAAAESAVERRVPLAQVRVRAADNPRPVRGVARLAANIRRFGQLTPVVVTPDADDGLRLVTGFRRMAALELAGATHVRVRVVPDLDAHTAAALYVAENCLPDGMTSKAVAHLAAQLDADAPPAFAEVLAWVQADDEAAVEEVYLEDMAGEARNHLAEGAAWVAALRPYWGDLEAEDRLPLVELLTYFARVSARLSGPARRVAPMNPRLLARHRIRRAVRAFLDERGYVEIEAPLLVVSPGLEPHLDAFEVPTGGPRRYLHTSPEYALKRLLGDGFERIYSLVRVFATNPPRTRTAPSSRCSSTTPSGSTSRV
jgi:hypothetical protein